jgi:hypothetical protein
MKIKIQDVQDRLDLFAPKSFQRKHGKQFLRLVSLRFKALKILAKKENFFTNQLANKIGPSTKEERSVNSHRLNAVLKAIARLRKETRKGIRSMNLCDFSHII